MACDEPGHVTEDRGDAASPIKIARAQILRDLQHACDRRHRATLERELERLDAELARLGV